MRMRTARLAILGLALTFAASAQEWLGDKDFLTQHEVDIIRETQEPNERVATYLHFAALRLELVSQLLAKGEEGRGGKIHEVEAFPFVTLPYGLGDGWSPATGR